MEFYVFSVRIASEYDKFTIARKWSDMVKNANPENKTCAESAHEAICRFAERDCTYTRYGDYVAGTAERIEKAAHIKVEYVPRAHTCFSITM